MIEIEGLTKRFGEKTAVDDLTLAIPRGRLFAFLGPNGAGKTTTIKMLCGLLRPDAGKVRVCGHDMSGSALEAKAKIAYIPDQPYLYDKLSGREFLTFVARMYALDEAAFEERLASLVESFDMADYLDDLCESYSHGMKQRLVISAALLHEPEVIIVDEPMVGLDPRSARLMKDILRRRARAGATVFMSTHTLAIAEEVADDIGIIHHGRLIAQGSVAELHAMSESPGNLGNLEDVFLDLTAEE